MTRFAGKMISSGIWILSRLPFAGRIELAKIMTDSAEPLLNLPGMLPYFATRRTPLSEVRNLMRSLHPMRCASSLIRMGASGDGGYLVPDDLEGITACFSPGVSTSSRFELDCANRGMKVFMADASVDGPAEAHAAFRFAKKFIGASTRDEFISMEDWITESAGSLKGDFMLQMDIEGAEYESLLSLPMMLQQRFRILVIEFHYLDYLFSEPLFRLISAAFLKLNATHQCVHIHPNNVCGIISVGGLQISQMAEFTFIRRDRVGAAGYAAQFPHPLDRDNCAKPPVILPGTMYRGESSRAEFANAR